MGEPGGCGGRIGGPIGGWIGPIGWVGGARPRGRRAGHLGGKGGRRLVERHLVPAQRRHQAAALVADEARRVEGVAARDRPVGARVEAEPLQGGHVVRGGALLQLEPHPLDGRPVTEGEDHGVAPGREALAQDRPPARALAGAHHGLAAAVRQPPLAGARRDERRDGVKPRLGQVDGDDRAQAASPGAQRHRVETGRLRPLLDRRGGRFHLELVAGDLDRRRRGRQLVLDVDRLERGDREVLGRGHSGGLPPALGLDRVDAGRGDLHLAEGAPGGEQELCGVGARVEVGRPAEDPPRLGGRVEGERLDRGPSRHRHDLGRRRSPGLAREPGAELVVPGLGDREGVGDLGRPRPGGEDRLAALLAHHRALEPQVPVRGVGQAVPPRERREDLRGLRARADRFGHVQRPQQHARPQRVRHRRRSRIAEERHQGRRSDHRREDERLHPAPH